MTRKDFIAIATALRESDASNATISAVADVLENSNPAFDWKRFVVAATPPDRFSPLVFLASTLAKAGTTREPSLHVRA